jgi:hypothetical protein
MIAEVYRDCRSPTIMALENSLAKLRFSRTPCIQIACEQRAFYCVARVVSHA